VFRGWLRLPVRFDPPSQEVSVGSVFISYRREDSEGQARALFQDLVSRLGKDAVFMDVDSIALGRDFREVLQERLASCDLMLVLIGRDWLSGKDDSGRRRLDNPADFVRLEIAAALKRKIPITPLLLRGAQMPNAEQLPENIGELAYRNGFELSHNRWNSDVLELIKRLGLGGPDDASSGGEGRSPAVVPQPSKKRWLVIAAVLAIVAIAGAGTRFLYLGKGAQQKTAEASQPGIATSTKLGGAPGTGRAEVPARTYRLDAADSRLSIDQVGSYKRSPFTIDELDLDKDFRIDFQINSTRSGGSTRYGIAWNYSADDFMLFTLHSTTGGFFSIGAGKSRTRVPWSRLAEGPARINAESGFDLLQIRRVGDTLVFAINGQDVWTTNELRLNSRQFAFWVADSSEASMPSYTLRQ
jgi:hypothetical protein